LVLFAALTVALPGSTEAAGRGSAVKSGEVWELVVSWFSDLWNVTAGKPVSGASAVFSTVGQDRATGAGSTPAAATVCKGDQGVCIDPNG
jgi:hypothetical protein